MILKDEYMDLRTFKSYNPQPTPRLYTEAELLKAVEYGCNYQKACDYIEAGNCLIEDFEDVVSATAAGVNLLHTLSDTNTNAAKEISINEIHEYLEQK